MYNIVRWGAVGGIIVLLLGLTGCIQPIAEVDQTKTVQATMGFVPVAPATATQPAAAQADVGIQATATQPPAPTPVVSTATSAPMLDVPQQVDRFIRERGDMPANLVLWGDQMQSVDRLVGFSYTGAAGMPCMGYLLLTSVNGAWQPSASGAVTCAQTPSVDVLAAHTFILTTDGQPNSLVFGRVDNPAVTQVQVSFDDGSSQVANVASGGFLIVKPGVTSPTGITGLDAQSSPILPNIPSSPV